MRVGDYAREQDYVNQKVADYNKENPGSGENWLKAWRNNRFNLFQPAFRKNMNALIKPLSMNTNKLYTYRTNSIYGTRILCYKHGTKKSIHKLGIFICRYTGSQPGTG